MSTIDTNSEVTSPASAETDNPTGTGPAAAAADGVTSELVSARMDAVAARTGLDDAYADVVLGLFGKTGKEPSKENLTKFVEGLREKKPGLFVAPTRTGATTSPVTSAPSAPAPGVVESATSRWQALRSAGRTADAEAFYIKNRSAITRGQ